MFQFVEPRVRRAVVEHLGVGIEDLALEVSLTDDLAADSLDLLELALALEDDLGLEFPQAALDRIRTYGDLLETVFALTRLRPSEDVVAATPATLPYVWVRVLSPRCGAAGLLRAEWLTPYTAETIAEDALRAGRGTRLEITVPSSLSDAAIVQLRADFAWLGEYGVQVGVARQQNAGPLCVPARPSVAA